MRISNLFNTLPKKLAASAMVALAVAFPAAAVTATAPVQIQATTGVANVTAGDTSYSSSTSASYNQLVKVEVTYYNPNKAGSGLVAQGLHVKINIPTKPGEAQTITTTTGGSNTNTVNGQAVVNLNNSNAYLQYVSGSAQAKITEPDGQIEQVVVPDSEIENAQGYALNNGDPCQAAAVAVEARVMVPGVKIVKQVEKLGQSNAWAQTNTANPGDTLKYMITYQDTGNTEEDNVVIRDNLPPKMTLVPGTTYLYNHTNPNGIKSGSDNIASGGIVIGNYNPGATAYVTFEVKVPEASQLACGATIFRNVGVARPQGLDEYYNTAATTVTKQCSTPTTPTTPTTPVTPASTPTQLVNTGPGDVVGIFAATTVGGALFHRLFWVRRLARRG